MKTEREFRQLCELEWLDIQLNQAFDWAVNGQINMGLLSRKHIMDYLLEREGKRETGADVEWIK